MIPIMAVLLKDGYKAGHVHQYSPGTTLVYSNLTPRSSRVPGVEKVVAFGFQYFVREYLQRQFFETFFAQPRDVVAKRYQRRLDNYLGPSRRGYAHIGELHEVGHLPLRVKAVPEGTLVPLRTPLLTIVNTDPKFYWLTNMVETLMSNVLFLPITSATTAFQYRQCFDRFAKLTGADRALVPWQGHDFSMRGIAGVEAALLSGAAHLLSFTGTDTIPAIDFLEHYYGADCEKEVIGGSVPATEHSVMCIDGAECEAQTITRLLQEYPTGILSVVCDTWDFWQVLTETLPALKDAIMARDGKLVVRPDSGDPVDIVCGERRYDNLSPTVREMAVNIGAVAWLWEVFGGTVNDKGYMVLDPHAGLIYGDSITRERQECILGKLMAHGFASSNVVLGIGSYTYQHVTRDTYGLAVKATYAEVNGEQRPMSKAPKTDDGTKNSARGLLHVDADGYLIEDVSWRQERQGLLKTIFEDGVETRTETLAGIRARLEAQL